MEDNGVAEETHNRKRHREDSPDENSREESEHSPPPKREKENERSPSPNPEERELSPEAKEDDRKRSSSPEEERRKSPEKEEKERKKSPARHEKTREKSPSRKGRDREKSPSRKERERSPPRREKEREKSPSRRDRERSPARRERSPRKEESKSRRKEADSSQKKEKSRRSRRSRSRSQEVKRRRDDRSDRNGESGDRRRERKEDKDDLEEGEVKEPPRELTKRELERLRLIQEMEDQDNEDEGSTSRIVKKEEEATSRSCPYLDTIDRAVLDFDFEKLCSVSLSTMNVYACMICGKYFQGRGTNTHAYTHSLDTDHRVFLNLQTLKFYCLPDNYEIVDPSLDDIKYVLKPSYSKGLIGSLDTQSKMARAYDDTTYFPGVVGLNNIKANDYCNVVLQALSHVIPLRNYFLQEENYSSIKRPPGDTLFELPRRFGELLRKLWNPKAFRKHVSPHEMLQASVVCSKKRFQIIEQSDAAEFMTFLLNTLHTSLNGTQKSNSSIIYKTFRGRMRQYSRQIVPAEATEDQARDLLQLPAYQETCKEFPFLYLSMDLPAAPLYRDSQLENIIPQVPLQVLLGKFNGSSEKEYKTYNENIMKRFEIIRLPEYLIIMYKRFHKNQWYVEKNPTIVNFPITNVDMYECLTDEAKPLHKYTTYDLVANVVHDGTPEEGAYRIQQLHQGSGKWFQLEDLHVEEILPQVINLAEAYIQVWKLNRKLTREERMSEVQEEALEEIPGLQMSNPFNPQLPPKP